MNAEHMLWRSDWVSEFEGPYSRCFKFMLANSECSDSVARNVLGAARNNNRPTGAFHPRTLLSAHWVDFGDPAAASIRRSLVRNSLEEIVGPWWRLIATDDYLRFCPVCLRSGFHSALTQIVGLERCPTHNTVLANCCQFCGEVAPRFALDRSVDVAGICINCGFALAGRGFEVTPLTHWRPFRESEAAHHDLATSLRPLANAALVWDHPECWTPDDASDVDQRKRCIFHALRHIVDLRLPKEQLSQSSGVRVATAGLSSRTSSQTEHTAIIKSIRRRLFRAFGRKLRPAYLSRNVRCDAQHRQIIPLPSCDPQILAVLTWLWRFGAWTFDPDWGRDRFARIDIPPALLEWPGPQLILNSWGNFAWDCWLADFQSAKTWQCAVQSGGQVQWSDALHLSNAMRMRLSADAAVPPSITAVFSGINSQSERAWMIGTPPNERTLY